MGDQVNIPVGGGPLFPGLAAPVHPAAVAFHPALRESHKIVFPYAAMACNDDRFNAPMNRKKILATPTKISHLRSKHAAGPVSCGWRAAVVLAGVLLAGRVGGQEIPRPSYARQVEKTSQPTIANFKVGEVLLRVDARLGVEFVDNVDLTPHAKADLIVTPEIGITATWAVTKLNTLKFRGGLGYAYYLNSPRLNRQTTTITPDSALSFNLYAGDVKINFHDQFSLQQEVASQGTLSGVAQVPRFTNTLGVSFLWDTNDIIWNFGYDHFSFITLGGADSSSGTTSSSFSNQDHSTDQFSASVAVKINSVLIGGIEATASYSDYPEQSASNFTSISVGPHLEFQLTKYTHVFLSGGYKGYYSDTKAQSATAAAVATAFRPVVGDQTGYYANLSFVHHMSRYYSDRLDIAHADDVEGLSGHTQTNSVRYSSAWQLNKTINLSAGLFYDDVHIVGGNVIGGTAYSDYSRFGASLSTGFQISPHVALSFGYQYVKKTAVLATENYTQNRLTFSLGYRF